jgi:hypothetical protein
VLGAPKSALSPGNEPPAEASRSKRSGTHPGQGEESAVRGEQD